MSYTFNARPTQQAVGSQARVVHVTILPAPAPRIVVVTRNPDGGSTAAHEDRPRHDEAE